MGVAEQTGLYNVPAGWPINQGPDPNPGTSGSLLLSRDDACFLHGRDYFALVPESYRGSWSVDSSQYVRVFMLMADNIYDTSTGNTEWFGRHAYVSKRREWLFAQRLLGYPYFSDGALCRSLPEPLRWGGTEYGYGNSPPFYEHSTEDTWMWNDVRHAVKINGYVTAGSNIVNGLSSTAGLRPNMAVEGAGIRDGTTLTGFINTAKTLTLSKPAATGDGSLATLWAYDYPLVRRYTHWCTKIISVEGIGEIAQCPHSASGTAYLEIKGTLTNGSPEVANIQMIDDDSMGRIAAGMYISCAEGNALTRRIPAGTTIQTVTSSGGIVTGLTMTAAATASGVKTIGIYDPRNNGAPANESYRRLKFTCLFERPNYEIMTKRPSEYAFDAENGGEWGRNVIYNEQPQARFLQIRGKAKWDTNASAYGQPGASKMVDSATFATKEGLPKLSGENMIVWKWLDVPLQAYNWERIQSYFGCVNDADFPPDNSKSPFLKYGKETLLLRTAERLPKTCVTGAQIWDITFHFQHSPATDGYGNWNRLLNPLGVFQRFYATIEDSGLAALAGSYFNDGETDKNYYKTVDFKMLFKP